MHAGEGGSSSSSSEGEQEGFDAQLRIEGDFKCVPRLFPFESARFDGLQVVWFKTSGWQKTRPLLVS